ncbi:uncharacterized protein F5147DRAFT_723102 [Suillus discolor]|uniref:Uncharacterized protein n=1 Tax=Suillus discolor TaxID=1912936 RepID=A0A9P7JN67_9AGAM|nr:uncharacterized protein F5147DRAFT_723102 [Suillus discolor]KAG2091852.1 hypothetical protein F5147DRAFT_723102 [Suillus discolor]
METPTTLDWVDISSKMHSFKRLASIWQSDFHLNSVLKKQQLLALSCRAHVILVVDTMAIFATKATVRDTCRDSLVRVGTQQNGICPASYRAPESGQRLEELPIERSFYVHIWDFNRAISRFEDSGNVYDYNSPGRLICRLSQQAQMCFTKDDRDIITNHPYTTVCPTDFSTRHFDCFLELDRLTLILAHPGSVQI